MKGKEKIEHDDTIKNNYFIMIILYYQISLKMVYIALIFVLLLFIDNELWNAGKI